MRPRPRPLPLRTKLGLALPAAPSNAPPPPQVLTTMRFALPTIAAALVAACGSHDGDYGPQWYRIHANIFEVSEFAMDTTSIRPPADGSEPYTRVRVKMIFDPPQPDGEGVYDEIIFDMLLNCRGGASRPHSLVYINDRKRVREVGPDHPEARTFRWSPFLTEPHMHPVADIACAE